MKKAILAIVITLIVGSVLSGDLFAQKRGASNWAERGLCQGRILDRLDLTVEQEDEISDLRYEHQLQATELRSKLIQNRLKLQKLFDEDNVDESAVMNIVEENNSIRNQLSKNRMEMRLKINSILTPEQKEELKDKACFGMGIGRNFGDGYGKGFGRGYGQGFGEGRHWRCPNF
jgi:protein CpxP